MKCGQRQRKVNLKVRTCRWYSMIRNPLHSSFLNRLSGRKTALRRPEIVVAALYNDEIRLLRFIQGIRLGIAT